MRLLNVLAWAAVRVGGGDMIEGERIDLQFVVGMTPAAGGLGSVPAAVCCLGSVPAAAGGLDSVPPSVRCLGSVPAAVDDLGLVIPENDCLGSNNSRGSEIDISVGLLLAPPPPTSPPPPPPPPPTPPPLCRSNTPFRCVYAGTTNSNISLKRTLK